MIAEVNQILNQVNILKGTLFENKSEIKYENDSNSSEPNMVSENVQMQS